MNDKYEDEIIYALSIIKYYINNVDDVNEKLSFVDREITDIEHCLEFSKLDAVRQNTVVKLLKNKLRERRIIKNKFAVLRCIRDSFNVDNVINVIEKSKCKKYKKRTEIIVDEI